MDHNAVPFDWSRGHEVVPIPCLNDIDNEPHPALVEYLTQVRVASAYQARIMEASTNMQWCECTGTCQPSSAKIQLSSCSCRIAYTSEGLLTDQSQPVLECHSQCRCSHECVNRQVSRGLHHSLALRKTALKGWSLITCSSIRAGQFIVEYCGELISTAQSRDRFMNYDGVRVNYLLVMREWSPSQNSFLRTNIDATQCGNVARFMNHSCAPNCALVPVRVGTIVPRAAIFALRDINAGEELCFDYGVVDGQMTGVKCQCGADNCRGWLPRDSSV